MTSAEIYAQKRIEAESLIRTHAPQRLQSALVELLRPAIALGATRFVDEEIPIGQSKFGGAPDVPAKFVWPTWNEKPLGFLAQINLEEIAAFDIENQLPKSGLLSFFCFVDEEEPIWGNYDQRDGWRVFFFQENELQRAQTPPCFAAHSSSFDAEWTTLDDYNCFPAKTLEWNEYDTSAHFPQIMEFEKKFNRRSPVHRLLGFSKMIQHEPSIMATMNYQGENSETDWEEAKKDVSNWQLLLQFDSDDSFGLWWGDGGTLYFLMRREDLANQRFENCWLVMDCG